MAVRNPNKGNVPRNLPKRKHWLGIPAGHELPQLPTSPRGKRKQIDHPDHDTYVEAKKKRAMQRCPADKSKPYRKGPSKRAPGTSREQWIALCTGGVK